MGFFDIFKKIGSGITGAVSSIGHGIGKIATSAYDHIVKPVYTKVLKPVYNSVIKPVVKPIASVVGKTVKTAETMVKNQLDFSQRFVSNAQQQGALNLEQGAVGLTKFLSNPMVMLGAGIAGLIVVSKI